MASLRIKTIWPFAAALDVDPSALIVDDGEPVNDLYCVRSGSRRALPVSTEGIAKDLLSPPTGMIVIVKPGDSFAFSWWPSAPGPRPATWRRSASAPRTSS